jgi:hypothetical protein
MSLQVLAYNLKRVMQILGVQPLITAWRPRAVGSNPGRDLAITCRPTPRGAPFARLAPELVQRMEQDRNNAVAQLIPMPVTTPSRLVFAPG